MMNEAHMHSVQDENLIDVIGLRDYFTDIQVNNQCIVIEYCNNIVRVAAGCHVDGSR